MRGGKFCSGWIEVRQLCKLQLTPKAVVVRITWRLCMELVLKIKLYMFSKC
jgi:hypothetical protein